MFFSTQTDQDGTSSVAFPYDDGHLVIAQSILGNGWTVKIYLKEEENGYGDEIGHADYPVGSQLTMLQLVRDVGSFLENHDGQNTD